MNDKKNTSGYTDMTAYVAIKIVDGRDRPKRIPPPPSQAGVSACEIGIKPCGFCLDNNVYCDEMFSMNKGEEYGPYAVHCRQCQASGPVEFTREQAILAWNRFEG